MRARRPIHRPCLFALLAVALAACSSAAVGSTPPATASRPRSPEGAGTAAAGGRTVIEIRVADHPEAGALVTEVVEGAGGATATLRAVSAAEHRLLVEEVVLDRERFLHMAGVEGILLERAAWIRFDTADPRHLAYLDANPTGLVELARLFDARAGDPYGDDEIDEVEHRGDDVRVVRTAAGLEITVRREELRPAPSIDRPDSLPVVPFEDVEQLIDGAG